MNAEEAERTSRFFDGGVKAGIWCLFHKKGYWRIEITGGSEGSHYFDDLDSVLRLADGLQKALRYVQQNSEEECWKECDRDALQKIISRPAASLQEVKG